MIYFRCKCGHCYSWSSMGVPPCRRCAKCGSDYAEGPGGHRDPVPHEIVRSKVEADEGEAFEVICIVCLKKKAAIEKAGEPWVWFRGSMEAATQ